MGRRSLLNGQDLFNQAFNFRRMMFPNSKGGLCQKLWEKPIEHFGKQERSEKKNVLESGLKPFFLHLQCKLLFV